MRLGIEVGGTFTDLLLVRDDGTVVATGKTFSTPRDPAEGVLHALDQLDPNALAAVPLLHGSTVATNAVIERRGPRLGFVATAGFRDILELQRQDRTTIYDLDYQKPRPLAGRAATAEVRERVAADGSVVVPLDLEDAHAQVSSLLEREVGAVAVCLLHSYRNPQHEQRLRELIAELAPGAAVSISSDVAAEFREYERASTTTVDAFVKPTVGRYVGHVEREATRRGIRDVSLMQSNGGLLPAAYARDHPVQLLFSGPAAGVTGALRIAEAAGVRDLITIDMGGTSTDVCLVSAGEPSVTTDGSIAGVPVKVPMLDIVSVGAGGGSVAWLDSGGMLQVGPGSAGADPGPACYGRGGTLPTTTDANVVRGLLRPHHFLGGRLRLDERAAHVALAGLGTAVGRSATELSEDIFRIANSTMASAIREVSVERGRDPRDYVLVAYGGAGPLHAASVAEELNMDRVLVGPHPGLVSAFGLVAAGFKRDFAQTAVGDLATMESGDVLAVLGGLEERARGEVAGQGVEAGACVYAFSIDMRYRGQGFEVPVPITAAALQSDGVAGLADRFHAVHAERYGTSRPGQAVEAVTYRLAVSTERPPGDLPTVPPEAGSPSVALPIRLDGRDTSCVFHWRPSLQPGALLDGPAIVEEETSTTFVPPGWTARVTGTTSLWLERKACESTPSR